jgi:hypothetical protein
LVITRKLVSVRKITRNYESELLRVSRNYDVEVHENHEIIQFRILSTKKSTFLKWKLTKKLQTFVITSKLVSVQKITRNYEPILLRVSRKYDVEVHEIHEITHFLIITDIKNMFFKWKVRELLGMLQIRTNFRSFFLVITSIMVTNFRNYEAS